jgi:hypothetical protein
MRLLPEINALATLAGQLNMNSEPPATTNGTGAEVEGHPI